MTLNTTVKRGLILLGLLGVCGVLALVWAKPLHSNEGMQGRDLALGKTLYAEHCAACHGADLQGEADWRYPKEDGTLPAPPHDETGHTWHHDDTLLFDYTKLGGAEALRQRGLEDFDSAMPGFEASLSDEEIWSVLAYIRSTWPPRIQEMQAAQNP